MAYQTTYDVTGNREDLTDIIVNISPKATYLLSNLRRTTARARYHEWQADALAAAVVPAGIEGADSTSTTRVARSRLGNFTSIVKTLITVSDTQVDVDTAGTANEYEYEISIGMEEHARDWEKGFIQSTSASGLSGTARTMSGLLEVLSTNVSSSASSRDYAYAVHYPLGQLVADQGGDPDVLYYKSAVVTDIAAHPASAGGGGTVAPVVIQAPAGGITDYYEFYHDSFGRKKLVPNFGNFAIPTATASGSVLMLTTKVMSIAFLRPTHTKPLAYLGGGPRAKIETEATLVWGRENAHGVARGISN